MTDEKSGLAIALERIEREASERTGFLDLGRLGLREFPDALFRLKHLRALNLGSAIPLENGGWRQATSDIAPNDVAASLERLSELPALEALFLRESRLASLASLIRVLGLGFLDCSETQISDLTPLAGLARLVAFNFAGTAVSDLTPLRGHSSLWRLDCSWTQVSDLAPLAGLSALLWLDCSGSAVRDLAPLAELSSLRWLDCSHTKVSDLAPLAGIVALQDLSCWDTQIHNLEPLKELVALQRLFCDQTSVSDLSPLAELSSLQWLYCSYTQVADLAPLASLSALTFLAVDQTKVMDLAPLAGLLSLQLIDCCYTGVSDLTPLAGLTALKEFLCGRTNVGDLTPLVGLPKLRRLVCSDCRLASFPLELLNSDTMEELTLDGAFAPGVPAEVLSGKNCLESLRAHYRDLDAGSVEAKDVKLVILGNGRVGKTQICRRLRGEDYDPTIPSTHGIKVGSASLPMRDGEDATKLHIWDFGGQDIYHGTHALFMRTNAVFVQVWTPELEDRRTHEHDGMLFRNYPLAYWVDYVRQLGGKDVPVLVVQTRCDRPVDRAVCPVPTEKLHEAFDYHPSPLHYSAANNDGRAALDEALQQAVRWLHERQGIATIGAGRQRVKQQLEAMRDADAEVPVEQRQYRTITQEHFRRICAEENGTRADPRYLLAYLHNAGIVFHREGLFDDCIVLDQQWALDAIYAVFNREKCVKILRQQHGRFTRSLLELIVWQGYKPAEQKLFLGMMQSCGICFVHKPGDERRGIEPEFIAPDLLPEKSAIADQLAEKWDPTLPVEETPLWEFDLLHQGLIRAILSRIGDEAGVSATYWQGGLCVFETTTRSHALIEQETGEGWAGRIRLQTQGGQATTLLERLSKLIEDVIQRLGLASCRAPRVHRVEIHDTLHIGATAEAVAREGLPALTYGEARSPQPRFYVSYAWRDASDQGREAIVDRLCTEAEKRGTRIIRDKTTLKIGDSIAKFMKKIGQGDRVFIILSDKYLKSPFCMFELFEIWRNSRQEEEELLNRCRVFCLDDAEIGTLLGRLSYAEHWKTAHDQIKAVIDRSGASLLGEKDFAQFRLMQQFAHNVSDILALFADIVQPRSFEELEKYGFDDPPGSSNA